MYYLRSKAVSEANKFGIDIDKIKEIEAKFGKNDYNTNICCAAADVDYPLLTDKKSRLSPNVLASPQINNNCKFASKKTGTREECLLCSA